MIVEIEYMPTPAAKICFNYRILSKKDRSLIATGSSVQVFLDKDYQLVWNNPEFYEDWKLKNGVI